MNLLNPPKVVCSTTLEPPVQQNDEYSNSGENGNESILDKLASAARFRVEQRKSVVSFSDIICQAQKVKTVEGFPFERALKKKGICFICEIKRASPSKGIIAPYFPYMDIAKEYERAGADAISVLTEPYFFQGSETYLHEIQQEVSVPILRKDFIIDPYQLCETKILGASAVLLICSLLNVQTLREYISVCDELGRSAMVEAHNERELDNALTAGARVIGVNNRNLKDFTLNMDNSITLRKLVPDSVLFVAESGIRDENDIARLEQAGVNGVLIGETLMRSTNTVKMLQRLRGGQG